MPPRHIGEIQEDNVHQREIGGVANVGVMDIGQDELPSLPVPPLQQTMDRYLDTIRPFCTDEEYENTSRLVKEFCQADGEGKRLQDRLEQRAIECNANGTSWLAEWWDDFAYFSHRDSITFYVNYYFGFREDPRNPSQTARAASLVTAALKFRQLIQTRELKPDMCRSNPYCMYMYNFLFNHCRYPAKPRDFTKGFDLETNNHLAVVRNGKFYIFDTVRRDGTILSTEEIMSQLERIIELADKSPEETSFSVLTTSQRDTWADDRVTLIRAHPENERELLKIESAMFLLCLDPATPTTRDEFSRLLWHGDGRNRFFDKSFQLIVFANGKAGYNGEHSKMDGTTSSRMCHFMIEEAEKAPIPVPSSDRSLPEPNAVTIRYDQATLNAIDKATKTFYYEVGRHEMAVMEYQTYGKGLVKQFKVSPDAFVQMAIQLAYYRMHGRVCATYESAATRKYKRGRTETARSVSMQSLAWVKCMDQANFDSQQKIDICKQAIAQQSKYTLWSVDGQAVDRHLLGLRFSVRPGESYPAVFADPVYKQSVHWKLSTSQISDDVFEEYGWGEVVPDGYGVAYMIKENTLHFNIASLQLGSRRLCNEIARALDDMKTLLESTIKPTTEKKMLAEENSNHINRLKVDNPQPKVVMFTAASESKKQRSCWGLPSWCWASSS